MARTRLHSPQVNTDIQQAQSTGTGTTTSTSYVTTLTGDAVAYAATVTVGASGIVVVHIRGIISNSGANYSLMGVALSGANTVAATDGKAIFSAAGTRENKGITITYTGLTPGSTTFTLSYRVSAGTGTFEERQITVLPQ